jgi:hypothetical protein
MGYFFAKNESGLSGNFKWPYKGWLLILSAVFFTASTKIYLFSNAGGKNTTMLFLDLIESLLMIDSVCILQLIALLLVSSRQTYFIKNAARNSKSTTITDIRSLLREYENISQGIEPLYVVLFSIHAPIILCFAYIGMTHSMLIVALTGCTNIIWSSLILIHICLISEDCHDALQGLVPAIRYL